MGGITGLLLLSGEAVKLFEWLKGSAPGAVKPLFNLEYLGDGLVVRFSAPLKTATVDALFEAAEGISVEDTYLTAYLSQLIIEERCRLSTTKLTLSWDLVYQLLADEEHRSSAEAFGLPAERELIPILDCSGTLTDADFVIVVDGWAESDQEVTVSSIRGAVAMVGGVDCLLPESAWRMVDAINRFERPPVPM